MLRGAFLALFAAQTAVALLVALAVVAFAGRHDAPSAAVAGVAIAAAVGQMLLGAAITVVGVRNAAAAARPRPDDPEDVALRRRSTARRSALSLALLAAVLASTPAWFAAFAWATGQRLVTIAVVGAVLGLGYGFGALQMGTLARVVTDRVRA